jgi:hypothetical protein
MAMISSADRVLLQSAPGQPEDQDECRSCE